MISNNNGKSNTNRYEPISNNAWKTIEEPLTTALHLAEEALRMTTGHDDYQRQKIAYYILATHYLPRFDPFPALVVYGNPSTGKSATLDVVAGLALSVFRVAGSTLTEAGLKNSMAEAARGTLLIEEGDSLSTRDLEDVLITRYSQSTGRWVKMVTSGQGIWTPGKFSTFGATALHRRNLFRDPALLRRVITVKTKRRKGDHAPVSACADLFDRFKALDIMKSSRDKKGRSTGDKLPELPEVENIWDIESGVFYCYLPLIALASYLEDYEFLAQLKVEMEIASERLKGEEKYLEAPTLLSILISLANEEMGGSFTPKRISIEVSKIEPTAFKEFGRSCPLLSLGANQRNRILREDFGFEIASAGGKQRVRFTIAKLIEVCKEYEVRDELLDEWEKQLGSMEEGKG